MMEIFIPFILVVEALLVQLPVLGPSILLISSKMTYFLISFVKKAQSMMMNGTMTFITVTLLLMMLLL